MKKVILITVCAFTTISNIHAQEIPTKHLDKESTHLAKPKNKLSVEQKAQKHVDELNTDVNLSEEQKSKVYNLALTKVKKVEEVKLKYKGKPEAKELAKNEIQSIKKEFRENVKLILNKEQLAKLKMKHDKMKDHDNSLDHD